MKASFKPLNSILNQSLRLNSIKNAVSVPLLDPHRFQSTTADAKENEPPMVDYLANKSLKYVPRAQYGGRHTVTMIPGVGIGAELMIPLKRAFHYAGVPVDFQVVDVRPNSSSDLEKAIMSIRRNGVAVKGNLEEKDSITLVSNRILRQRLDLYVSVLHCYSLPGIGNLKHRNQKVNIAIVRQNTEGEYSMQEHESKKGVVECLKILSHENAQRIARFAFQLAKDNNRKLVTVIHKANIMKISDGLFLDTCQEVAKEFPGIQYNDMIIDNCCMQLVSNPSQFDVMVMPNLYGSIVNNVTCGLLGGPGLFSGRNYGSEHAVFESGCRNVASWMVGKGIANPIVMFNTAIDLLYHLEEYEYAQAFQKAVHKTVNVDKVHTKDLNGEAFTDNVVDQVLSYIQKHTQDMDDGVFF